MWRGRQALGATAASPARTVVDHDASPAFQPPNVSEPEVGRMNIQPVRGISLLKIKINTGSGR
ncbi:hypothetical protein GCM10011504_50470 [Siccirubricoccus deserti]|nr:hypothetical protein GCM10011504_50470 [Siccirubricoccus deserti]